MGVLLTRRVGGEFPCEERERALLGGAQAREELAPRDFFGPEQGEVRGHGLDVYPGCAALLEVLHQKEHTELGGIADRMEHALAGEDPPRCHAVEPSHERPGLVPGLDTMGIADCVKGLEGGDHLRGDPGAVLAGTRCGAARGDHPIEGSVHGEMERELLTASGKALGDVQVGEVQNGTGIRVEPEERKARVRPGEDSLTVGTLEGGDIQRSPNPHDSLSGGFLRGAEPETTAKQHEPDCTPSGILCCMTIQEILAKKRDGHSLRADEIGFFVQRYTDGTLPDYQAAALLMAIYLRGMDTQETAALTEAMARSGEQLDLTGLPHALDKHSTGGVGDKTSLIVVPILAAAGIPVCKMSGRGLGHTGGTLDKLEAIPGFRIEQGVAQMLRQVHEIGCCIVGQTAQLAPADKKLYALRDATATVASLPLIVSSILSKKLAGGAPAFLFDVKVGSGALMKTEGEARVLAEALVAGAVASGRRATALVTDMSQPLGRAIGNALEVQEAVALLTTPEQAEPRLRALCLELAGQGIALAQGVTVEAGRAQAEQVLRSGAAAERWRELVRAQGGDPEAPLPQAPVVTEVRAGAELSGVLQQIETQALGELVVQLGGGRVRKEDAIDHAVGLEIGVGIGERVVPGQVLARLHTRTDEAVQRAAGALLAALRVGAAPCMSPPLIWHCIKE